MSEDKPRVHVDDLTVDSTLLAWELCVTENKEWVLRTRDRADEYITEYGEFVYPEDGYVPEEALFTSVIKAQSVAQEYVDTVDVGSESEDEPFNSSETNKQSNQEQSDEIDGDMNKSQVQNEVTTDSTDDMDGELFGNDGVEVSDEEFEAVSSLRSESDEEGEDRDVNQEEDKESGGLFSSVTELFSSGSEEDNIKEYDADEDMIEESEDTERNAEESEDKDDEDDSIVEKDIDDNKNDDDSTSLLDSITGLFSDKNSESEEIDENLFEDSEESSEETTEDVSDVDLIDDDEHEDIQQESNENEDESLDDTQNISTDESHEKQINELIQIRGIGEQTATNIQAVEEYHSIDDLLNDDGELTELAAQHISHTYHENAAEDLREKLDYNQRTTQDVNENTPVEDESEISEDTTDEDENELDDSSEDIEESVDDIETDESEPMDDVDEPESSGDGSVGATSGLFSQDPETTDGNQDSDEVEDDSMDDTNPSGGDESEGFFSSVTGLFGGNSEEPDNEENEFVEPDVVENEETSEERETSDAELSDSGDEEESNEDVLENKTQNETKDEDTSNEKVENKIEDTDSSFDDSLDSIDEDATEPSVVGADEENIDGNDKFDPREDTDDSSGIITSITGLFESDDESAQNSDPLDSNDAEEQGEVEEGLITKLKDYLGLNTESDDEDVQNSAETEQTDELTLMESIRMFLSTEIASIDQERPDAQNVSIDYIIFDGNFYNWEDLFELDNWHLGEPIHDFFDKLKQSREGDETARRDLYTDFKTRYLALVKYNPYARGDFADLVFMSLLTAMGVFLFTLGLVTMALGNIGGLEALTVTTSYGDHIMLTTILLSIASVSFWLSRRSSSKTLVTAIQTPARATAGFILFAQLAVVAYVSYALLLGSGQDALLTLELTIDNYVESGAENLPATIQDSFLSAYESYRGPESTVFGMSIMQASLVMAIVGSLTAYPVLKRTVARLVLTANMSPREFREETGILIEEIADEDADQYDGPLYRMGQGEVEEEGDRYEMMYGDENEGGLPQQVADATDELLTLPENIKGSPFANYQEVRRYWVRAPYAYVSIVYNEASNDYRYVVVEPELDEAERVVFDELKERLDTVLLFEDVEEKEEVEEENRIKLERLEQRMMELSQEYDIEINDETFHRLMYYVERDYVYFNKIDPLMNDPYVEDISCDGEGKYIFVFHSDYKDVITNVKFERDELRSFIQELAQRSGEHISAADPMKDASLPDGSRIQMTLGTEVTTHGSTFTIRLFEDIPFTPVDLLDYNTFSLTQMAYLWTAIEHNKSLIFAGGTASGKTTSMNAVSLFIPPKSKVITIEDTREIMLPQKNWIPGTTREGLGDDSGEIDMYELLRAALRQRPEYLVVGEIRGAEAETLFQAMNTGHTTYSTMHAETVDAAIGRLTNPPINVPKQMITALDIVCIQNQIRFTDEHGNAKNVRRNEETREIVKLRDNGQFENRRPFQWDAETDTFIKSLEDSHVLARIAEENGWTREERDEQLRQRKEVLEYMLDEDIREFEHVANVIQAYMVDSENIIHKVRNGTLDASELSSLTDMEWKTESDPDTTLNALATDDEPSSVAGDTQ